MQDVDSSSQNITWLAVKQRTNNAGAVEWLDISQECAKQKNMATSEEEAKTTIVPQCDGLIYLDESRQSETGSETEEDNLVLHVNGSAYQLRSST